MVFLLFFEILANLTTIYISTFSVYTNLLLYDLDIYAVAYKLHFF